VAPTSAVVARHRSSMALSDSGHAPDALRNETFATHGVFTYDREDRSYKLFWAPSLGYYPPSPGIRRLDRQTLILVCAVRCAPCRHCYGNHDDTSYSMKSQFIAGPKDGPDVLTGVLPRIH